MGYTSVDQVCALYPTFQRKSAWAASTSYIVSQIIRDSNNHLQKCTTAGISGATVPVWASDGTNTADGTVAWSDLGLTNFQHPPDAYIQTQIDAIAGTIDSLLMRRFSETINAPPYLGGFPTNFAAFIAGLPPQAYGLDAKGNQSGILETINRFGAAAQLGGIFASAGIQSAGDLAKGYLAEYTNLKDRLNAKGKNGEPISAGEYDHLFDSLARTETPRPGLIAIAGGDQQRGQVAKDIGMSNLISKFQVM